MKDLTIDKTAKTLEVSCSPGKLDFNGCSITNDPKVFFTPVKSWVKDYIQKPEKLTEINLKFDYIDTASVKYIFDILNDLKVLNSRKGYSAVVNWYFDYDDPEILELGEIIQSKIGIPFNFNEY
ncbi:MAG TPA: SiaC family regulatory phosphoprotein [Bacteroidales bacterium]|nr:SiaC family regulatory phosphoprotein [Bacteroidales bacterium]